MTLNVLNPLNQFGFYPFCPRSDSFEETWRLSFSFYDSLWTLFYTAAQLSDATVSVVSARVLWFLITAHSIFFYPFSVLAFVPLHVFPFLFTIALAFFVLSAIRPVYRLIPSVWERILSWSVFRIHNLLGENVGFSHLYYFNHIFIVFCIILFSNVLGLIPFFFTVTSQFAVTFALAAVFFIGFNLIAIRLHGLHFFNLFIPAGAPGMIRPFLVFIEFISYFARVLSLSIRLFANMTAGHTLMKILAGYVYGMLLSFGVWSFAGIFATVILSIVVALEVFIAVLQAYVFVMLLCVYLNDVLSAGNH